MAAWLSMKKIFSVLVDVRDNSRYHYPDKPFAVLRYLYISMLRETFAQPIANFNQ